MGEKIQIIHSNNLKIKLYQLNISNAWLYHILVNAFKDGFIQRLLNLYLYTYTLGCSIQGFTSKTPYIIKNRKGSIYHEKITF